MLLFDALGSTLGLLDSNGLLQTEYTYDPFGATTATGTANPNPLQYTGRENDGTGLYNYRARYYSPTLQRFISEDPVGSSGGDINLYAYALSSPTNFTDPLGFTVDATTIAGCFDTIRQARQRQKQMQTSGRTGIKGLMDAAEEMLRTLWETIECIAPVIIIGAATGGNGEGEGDNPNRPPGRESTEGEKLEQENRAIVRYQRERGWDAVARRLEQRNKPWFGRRFARWLKGKFWK